MSKKDEVLNALAKLDEAFRDLNTLWTGNYELDELDAIASYPFEISFDELQANVEDWVELISEEIEEKM